MANKCNVAFDYLSEHNGEYWYKCTTCGKSDWFSRSVKPDPNQPIKGCSGQPAFDATMLKVGDMFYSIKERNQAFHRSKIHKKIDGQDWFRYTLPLRTYELVTHKVLGILRKDLEGQWRPGDPDWDLETEYFVQIQDETHVGNTTTYLDEEDQYYLDKDQALAQIEILRAQAREMDKS